MHLYQRFKVVDSNSADKMQLRIRKLEVIQPQAHVSASGTQKPNSIVGSISNTFSSFFDSAPTPNLVQDPEVYITFGTRDSPSIQYGIGWTLFGIFVVASVSN